MDGMAQSAPNSAFRARIACITDGPTLCQELTTNFKSAGYLVETPDQSSYADLGLVDLRGASVTARKAKALATALRRKSPESTILFLVDPCVDIKVRSTLRRHGEVISAKASLDHALVRCRQLIRLRNIAEETGERLKSLATLNRLVEFPIIEASKQRLRILIAGAPCAAGIMAMNALKSIDGDFDCVLTAGQAMRALDHHHFDCTLFLPMEENDPLLALKRALRRHPKHAGMAIIQIADEVSDFQVYAKRGACDFILSTHLTADLGTRVQLSARRAHLTSSMQNFLRSCAGDGVCDSASGVFTTAFLTEHGARLCARADQADRALSFMLVKLTSSDITAKSGRRVLHHSARLINRITRAEDMVARIAPDKFVIASAATQLSDAQKIGLRIEGVLSSTAFGAREEKPYGVQAHTTVLSRKPGASIEECVAALITQAQGHEALKLPHLQSPQ